VKKSLTEGKPIIIGMNTPDSFFNAKNVWEPGDNPANFYGGHAMCVVGYDDSRNGGSFEIINSWGRKWGNGGFIWIPYKAFTDFVMECYEMIENLAAYSDTVKYDGFARMDILEKTNTKSAALVFCPDDGYYKTAGAYSEGTEFHFVVGARENAYVYTFAVSQSSLDGSFYSPISVFPPQGVSPLLNYRDSAVILPAEDQAFSLDNKAGTEYLVTLYAKQALNIRNIMRNFVSSNGSFGERLSAAVGDDLLSDISFNETEAAFSVQTDDARAVAALVVAIDHR